MTRSHSRNSRSQKRWQQRNAPPLPRNAKELAIAVFRWWPSPGAGDIITTAFKIPIDIRLFTMDMEILGWFGYMFLADTSSYGDTNRDWKILGNLPANSLECESPDPAIAPGRGLGLCSCGLPGRHQIFSALLRDTERMGPHKGDV